jgi:hypothetical protein
VGRVAAWFIPIGTVVVSGGAVYAWRWSPVAWRSRRHVGLADAQRGNLLGRTARLRQRWKAESAVYQSSVAEWFMLRSSMRSAQRFVVIGIAVLLLAMPASGQELKAVGEIRSEGPVTSEASKKIGSRLRGLIADFRALEIVGGIAAAQRFSSDILKVNNAGRVQIYVHVNDTSEQALDTLRRHGLDIEVVNDDFGIVQGWIPVTNLEALAAESVVVKVRPPSYAIHNTGPVTSQGDSIHRCDQARSLGFNGAGVMVGVISDGVSGLSASQTAGELGPVQVLSAGSGDEGPAMLEIIADCAPGATHAMQCVRHRRTPPPEPVPLNNVTKT